MSTQEGKTAAEGFIRSYADALNGLNDTPIAQFYSNEGQMMPEGYKTISYSSLQGKENRGYLKKSAFQINYSFVDTAVDGDYAFIHADASVSTTDSISGIRTTKTTRDFFVLRKEVQGWKILRYIFNNLIKQPGSNDQGNSCG
jgi:ketosteroid isomerase-like protein